MDVDFGLAVGIFARSAPLIFLQHLLRPLLELAENALKDKTMKDLGNKTISVLHHLCHPRKVGGTR